MSSPSANIARSLVFLMQARLVLAGLPASPAYRPRLASAIAELDSVLLELETVARLLDLTDPLSIRADEHPIDPADFGPETRTEGAT